MNSLKKANFTAIAINWVIDAFLLMGYVVEFIKGGRPLSYVVMICLLIFVPMLLVTWLYKKNAFNEKIKYISIVGYFILYIVALFTTSRLLVYVYMFPILSVYVLYFNLKLIVSSCIALVLSNVLRIVYFIVGLKLNSPAMTTDYTIQFASVSLFAIALILTTKLSNEFNRLKIESLKHKQEEQEGVTENLKAILEILKRNTNSITEIIGKIGETSQDLLGDLKEVEEISLLTDQNVQRQTLMTQNIQSMIEEAKNISNDMDNMAEDTTEAIEKGNIFIRQLEDSSDKLNENSEIVSHNISELSRKSEDIYSITEVITQIAERTNLLSLNASIESARAGEAGKGFSVVANEIRKLANESKSSAESIEEIIKDLMNSAVETVHSSEEFKKLNQSQNGIIKNTNEIFKQIHIKSRNLKDAIDKIHNTVDKVLTANNEIVESIDQISSSSKKTVEFNQKNELASAENHEFTIEANKLVEEIQKIYQNSEL